MQVKFYDNIEDEKLLFAVILTKHKNKWVFCKHKNRDTYEIPGGHREQGETILETAKRELYEETGAIKYEITPITVYSVIDGDTETFGKLYFAEVQEFEKELHSEIELIKLFDDMPENLTYPLIQPKLMEAYNNCVNTDDTINQKGVIILNIEHKNELTEELGEFIDKNFNEYATENNVTCNYTPFNFIAKEDNKVVGIITGHSYYKEVHIGDLIVLEEYRNKHIGTKLVKAVEEHFENKNFENINLSTYAFQAPEFYKKSGYKVEFIRENKDNPKLSKYFLVKYIK